MAKTDFKITFEFEPIVKLTCVNTTCRFNLVDTYSGYLACGLKEVEIGKDGICSSQESKKDEIGG